MILNMSYLAKEIISSKFGYDISRTKSYVIVRRLWLAPE